MLAALGEAAYNHMFDAVDDGYETYDDDNEFVDPDSPSEAQQR